MNSLEALNIIKEFLINNLPKALITESEKYVEQVETSLKALEIIKDLLNNGYKLSKSNINTKGIYDIFHKTKEEIDLIKKELEK